MSALDSRHGRHTRILLGPARDCVRGAAPSDPVVLPAEGFIASGVFYGRAKSPTGWHSVTMPLALLKTVL